MHLWKAVIALGLMGALAARATAIYKWTDADGVVHYSDHAPPGAERVVIVSGAVTGTGGGISTGAPSAAGKAPPAKGHAAILSILSPRQDQVFFNDEVVSIHADLAPELQPNQELTWNLNGSPLTEQGPNALAFSLPTLARGTYTLSATVTDTATGESQTANSVTFYVRQPSELSPIRKK
jgi:Domain of unknown function (DUF4124)